MRQAVDALNATIPAKAIQHSTEQLLIVIFDCNTRFVVVNAVHPNNHDDGLIAERLYHPVLEYIHTVLGGG